MCCGRPLCLPLLASWVSQPLTNICSVIVSVTVVFERLGFHKKLLCHCGARERRKQQINVWSFSCAAKTSSSRVKVCTQRRWWILPCFPAEMPLAPSNVPFHPHHRAWRCKCPVSNCRKPSSTQGPSWAQKPLCNPSFLVCRKKSSYILAQASLRQGAFPYSSPSRSGPCPSVHFVALRNG